jgi:hypothetical protein
VLIGGECQAATPPLGFRFSRLSQLDEIGLLGADGSVERLTRGEWLKLVAQNQHIRRRVDPQSDAITGHPHYRHDYRIPKFDPLALAARQYEHGNLRVL